MPGRLSTFTSNGTFEYHFIGFDGRSPKASKCPETPSQLTFNRGAKYPKYQSRRDYPAVILDPKATHINTTCHHTKRLVASNLTVCCVRALFHRCAPR